MPLNVAAMAGPMPDVPDEVDSPVAPTATDQPASPEEPVTPDVSQLQDKDPQFDPDVNPVVKMISNGDMPGIVGPPDQFKAKPELEAIISNPKSMMSKTGLGFFKTKDGQFAVYNPAVIKPAEIQDLDAKGKLDLMLTPIDKLFGGPGAASAGQGGGIYDSMLGGPAAGTTGPGMTPPGPTGPPANPKAVQTRMRASIATGLPAPRTPSPTGGSIYNKVIGKPV